MINSSTINQFKKRMRIYHDTEDDFIELLLESSFSSLKNDCGEFDIDTHIEGKELVFERARYAYYDSLEFFDKNFQSRIHNLGYQLAGETND